MRNLNFWHRDLDLILTERVGSVTEAERSALLPLVDCIVEIGIIAKKESILALEKFRKSLSNSDLSAGLRMLIDGIEPETVTVWYRNRIVYSNVRGLELLRLLVIGTGLDAAASGCDPLFLREFLGSYLGHAMVREPMGGNSRSA